MIKTLLILFFAFHSHLFYGEIILTAPTYPVDHVITGITKGLDTVRNFRETLKTTSSPTPYVPDPNIAVGNVIEENEWAPSKTHDEISDFFGLACNRPSGQCFLLGMKENLPFGKHSSFFPCVTYLSFQVFRI